MDNAQAVSYLESLIGRTLRVHTTDTRMFVGTFKCTDMDRNIILAGTYEFRFPSPSAVREAAATAGADSSGTSKDTVKVDMTSRLIGLVVVPGQHITRIELEETPDEIRMREARKEAVTG
ncbi:LSM domain protein [Thermoascus aurantiacus ATCC 26904]